MDGAKRSVGRAMALSGVLILATGALHPRPKGDTVTEAAVGMVGADGWVLAHLPQALGMLVLAVAALRLRRVDGVSSALRSAATLAVVGAVVAVVESVPHILATTEATALAEGGSTPLYATHMWLQALATPLAGAGVAAMAWAGSRDGVLGPRPLAVLGILGGIGFGLAGPSVLLTESMLLARLFMFTAAIAAWLLVAGVMVARPGRDRTGVGVVEVG